MHDQRSVRCALYFLDQTIRPIIAPVQPPMSIAASTLSGHGMTSAPITSFLEAKHYHDCDHWRGNHAIDGSAPEECLDRIKG